MDTTICPVCLIKVLDSEDGIACEKLCERWFHIECVRMSKTEYSKYASDTKKKWACNRADCLRIKEQPFNKLMDQMADLSSKMSTLISTIDTIKHVSTDVADIKNDLKALNDKFDSFDPRLAASEARITALENKFSNLGAQDHSSVTPEELLREIGDRSRCLSNVLVYGLPESSSNDPNVRKNFDLNKIVTLFSAVCPEVSTDGLKMFRLGAQSKRIKDSRPLKVICASELGARKLIENFNPDSVKALDNCFSNVNFGRDRTKMERQHLAKLRDELKKRSEDGESDLTIKYVRGVPEIVQSRTKN